MDRFRTSVLCVVSAAALGGLAFAQEAGRPEAKLGADTGVAADIIDRIVITGMIPIPEVGEGAPRYSSDDVETIETIMRKAQTTAERDARRCGARIIGTCDESSVNNGSPSLICEVEYARRTANLAIKAREATEAAEQARRDVSAGTADMKTAEAAELKRQEAVNEMERVRAKFTRIQADIATWQDLKLRGRKNIDSAELMGLALMRDRKGMDIFASAKNRPDGLSIENVRAEEREDSKGSFTVVFGDIRNGGPKALRVPNLSGALVDDRGWVLHKTSVEPDRRKTIQPGKTFPFGFEVRPAAEAATQAVVSFAAKNAPPPRLQMGGFFCNRRPW